MNPAVFWPSLSINTLVEGLDVVKRELGMHPLTSKLPSLKNFKNLRICIYILLLLPGKMDVCFQHGMFFEWKGLGLLMHPKGNEPYCQKNAWILTTKASKSQILKMPGSLQWSGIFIRVWNWKLGLQKQALRPGSTAPSIGWNMAIREIVIFFQVCWKGFVIYPLVN